MAELKVREGEGTTLAKRGDLYDPFNKIMQDVFESFRPIMPWFERAWMRPDLGRRLLPAGVYSPAFNVKERSDAYIVEGDLPGVKESDLEISLAGNRLCVSGKRAEVHREASETYYECERSEGAFTRTFTLPEDAVFEHITASLEEGVLSVLVPKKLATKSRKIALKEHGKKAAS